MIDSIDGASMSLNGLIAAANGSSVISKAQTPSEDRTQGVRPVNDVSEVGTGKSELTEEEKREVEELKLRDQEVRRHEQAHKAAAGRYASGAPNFEYETGPDGRQYAVGGEVQIDVSAVPDDPAATIAKMQQIQRAANAPAEPSAQDRRVAAEAAQIERQAQTERSAEGDQDGLLRPEGAVQLNAGEQGIERDRASVQGKSVIETFSGEGKAVTSEAVGRFIDAIA